MSTHTNVRGEGPTGSVGGVVPDGSPDTADLDARLRSADTDESAASDARVRYREHGMEPLEPDERIRSLLAPDEELLAVRRHVALARPQPSDGAPAIDPISGDLYVTSARLVHVGRSILAFDLDDIEDAALAEERVLLVLRDGAGIALDAVRPRLLRVQIAAARAARAGMTGRRRGRLQPASR